MNSFDKGCWGAIVFSEEMIDMRGHRGWIFQPQGHGLMVGLETSLGLLVDIGQRRRQRRATPPVSSSSTSSSSFRTTAWAAMVGPTNNLKALNFSTAGKRIAFSSSKLMAFPRYIPAVHKNAGVS
jgi:hypothetical protein